MNIRYYFAICAIILFFSPVTKASESMDVQGEIFVMRASTVSVTTSVDSEQAKFLLNKVIIPAHPGKHNIFWENVTFLFQKVKRIYTNLGYYLYSSIFSIFYW